MSLSLTRCLVREWPPFDGRRPGSPSSSDVSLLWLPDDKITKFAFRCVCLGRPKFNVRSIPSFHLILMGKMGGDSVAAAGGAWYHLNN